MPINVEEEIDLIKLEDINLQSQIDVLSECCATCGLHGGVPLIDLCTIIGITICLIGIGYLMGKNS